MEENTMKMLMTIKVEGGSIEDYDFYDEAVHCWRSKKNKKNINYILLIKVIKLII